jgi:hypothetical protein
MSVATGICARTNVDLADLCLQFMVEYIYSGTTYHIRSWSSLAVGHRARAGDSDERESNESTGEHLSLGEVMCGPSSVGFSGSCRNGMRKKQSDDRRSVCMYVDLGAEGGSLSWCQ